MCRWYRDSIAIESGPPETIALPSTKAAVAVAYELGGDSIAMVSFLSKTSYATGKPLEKHVMDGIARRSSCGKNGALCKGPLYPHPEDRRFGWDGPAPKDFSCLRRNGERKVRNRDYRVTAPSGPSDGRRSERCAGKSDRIVGGNARMDAAAVVIGGPLSRARAARESRAAQREREANEAAISATGQKQLGVNRIKLTPEAKMAIHRTRLQGAREQYRSLAYLRMVRDDEKADPTLRLKASCEILDRFGCPRRAGINIDAEVRGDDRFSLAMLTAALEGIIGRRDADPSLGTVEITDVPFTEMDAKEIPVRPEGNGAVNGAAH